MGNSINNHGNDNIILQDVKDSNITINKHLKPTLPKELTIRMPKLNLNDVIGREEEIADLHQSLFEHKQVVLVNGLGGIGKTTLSQAYLSQYAEQYQHLAWISVSSSSLESDFINAVLLDKTFGIKTDGKEATDIFHELLYDLKALDAQPNLLILDNADATLSSYYDRLPQQPNWHVLVTSREQIEGFESKEIGFLKPEKALLLFQKHCQRITDIEAIKNLLETIDYHTLTIEILAKTAQLQRLDIATLQNAIDKDLIANVFIPHKQDKIDKVYTYLSSIFDLSNVTDTEAWLLKQMACLPTEFHTYNLIKELICTPKSEQAELLPESIENLVAKGWLLKNSEADSYKMHIIIAEVTRRKWNIMLDEVIYLLDRIIFKLEIDQTKDNPVEKFKWIQYGKSMLRLYSKVEHEKIALLKNNLAVVIQDFGEFNFAKTLLEEAVILEENIFGIDHPNIATRYSNLGTIYNDLEEYEKASYLLEKATYLDIKNERKDYFTLGKRYNNLALSYKGLGKLSKSIEIFEYLLLIEEKKFGESHPNTALTYSNLATVLEEEGDYTRAKELLEKALKSEIHNFGEEHPNTSRCYSNLGIVLQKLHDFNGAKEALEKSVKYDEINFGEFHPVTAIRYSNLGILLQILQEYINSKYYLEKAVKVSIKIWGENHIKTAHYYSSLAYTLVFLEEFKKAKEYLNKTINIFEIALGKDNKWTIQAYTNLGLLFIKSNEYQQARFYLEKVKVFNKKTFGENSLETNISYKHLATLFKAQENYELEKIFLEKVMYYSESNFGKYHPNTAHCYSENALNCQALENYDEAKLFYEKAINIYENFWGTENLYTAILYSNLATLLAKINEFEDAISFSEKAITILKKISPNNHLYINTAIDIYNQIVLHSNFKSN